MKKGETTTGPRLVMKNVGSLLAVNSYKTWKSLITFIIIARHGSQFFADRFIIKLFSKVSSLFFRRISGRFAALFISTLEMRFDLSIRQCAA